VREQYRLYGASTILIEDKASGTQLIQELIVEGLSRVKGVKPDGDKIMRLHAQTATIENGFVHIPTSAHWLPDYLHEMSVFPNGRYDDQVDPTAQALAWTKVRPPNWGIFEFYKMKVEARKREQDADDGPMVRLLAPIGVGSLQTWSGRHLTVPEDRIVEVSTYDAGPLNRAGSLEVETRDSDGMPTCCDRRNPAKVRLDRSLVDVGGRLQFGQEGKPPIERNVKASGSVMLTPVVVACCVPGPFGPGADLNAEKS
jgi:Terminase RNaseH-like domain